MATINTSPKKSVSSNAPLSLEQLETDYGYKFVEGEATTLSAVFNKLFEMVEKELRS